LPAKPVLITSGKFKSFLFFFLINIATSFKANGTNYKIQNLEHISIMDVIERKGIRKLLLI
jgi:hypothetical protein